MNFIKSTIRAILITFAVIFFFVILIALAMPSEEDIATGLTDIKTDVATDFERQYENAKAHGSILDRCVRAGLVAEGYLQAGDEGKYADWKEVERADCQAAGVMR